MATRQTIGCAICKFFPEANTHRSHSGNFLGSGEKCAACGTNCGRPSLLDLFCGAGGCARGYQRAGFCVLGIDSSPQPRYAGCSFVQADAMTFPLDGFDVIHASPPCQRYSRISHLAVARKVEYGGHADLIDETRRLLVDCGKPYVIENVIGAPLRGIRLCGAMFGLKTYRHRVFETSHLLWVPEHPKHTEKVPPAGNGRSPNGFISICGSGGVRGLKSTEIPKAWGNAMGIDWMTRRELSQAIPPAYTEWIGRQLFDRLA